MFTLLLCAFHSIIHGIALLDPLVIVILFSLGTWWISLESLLDADARITKASEAKVVRCLSMVVEMREAICLPFDELYGVPNRIAHSLLSEDGVTEAGVF